MHILLCILNIILISNNTVTFFLKLYNIDQPVIFHIIKSITGDGIY